MKLSDLQQASELVREADAFKRDKAKFDLRDHGAWMPRAILSEDEIDAINGVVRAAFDRAIAKRLEQAKALGVEVDA
jgi:hypothetical protein